MDIHGRQITEIPLNRYDRSRFGVSVRSSQVDYKRNGRNSGTKNKSTTRVDANADIMLMLNL
jgi:hypothetical protein